MNPARGLDAFGLSIYEPVFFINTYGQAPWETLLSANDVFLYVQYEAHYLLAFASKRTMKRKLFGLVLGVAFTAVAAGAIGLWIHRVQRRSIANACINNMLQITLSGGMWAEDHGGHFPPSFMTMSNELSTPYVLHCPADQSERPVANWRDYTNGPCSYELVAPGLAVTNIHTPVIRCKIHGTVAYSDGFHPNRGSP